MKKHWEKISIILAVIAAILIIRQTGLHQIFTFENLKANKEALQSFVQGRYILSAVLFIIIYLFSVAFSIPGALILTLTGGFVFGTLAGAIYVNIGATAGAVAVFLFARYLLGNKLQLKYKDKLEKFNSELDENGYS